MEETSFHFPMQCWITCTMLVADDPLSSERRQELGFFIVHESQIWRDSNLLQPSRLRELTVPRQLRPRSSGTRNACCDCDCSNG